MFSTRPEVGRCSRGSKQENPARNFISFSAFFFHPNSFFHLTSKQSISVICATHCVGCAVSDNDSPCVNEQRVSLERMRPKRALLLFYWGLSWPSWASTSLLCSAIVSLPQRKTPLSHLLRSDIVRNASPAP